MTSILWWIGAAIGVAIALGIIVIGAAYLARSATNAAGFGLPTSLSPHDRGWWQVKGIRDVTTGVLVLAFLVAGTDRLPLLLGVLALIPLGDMLIVLGQHGSRSRALGIHGVTAVVLLGACILTAVGQAPW